jgi:hypothetical protein
VEQFLFEGNIIVFTQTLYSLDLNPSYFWLLPILKMGLKGTHFTTMEDMKLNAMDGLWKIPKDVSCQCFREW